MLSPLWSMSFINRLNGYLHASELNWMAEVGKAWQFCYDGESCSQLGSRHWVPCPELGCGPWCTAKIQIIQDEETNQQWQTVITVQQGLGGLWFNSSLASSVSVKSSEKQSGAACHCWNYLIATLGLPWGKAMDCTHSCTWDPFPGLIRGTGRLYCSHSFVSLF